MGLRRLNNVVTGNAVMAQNMSQGRIGSSVRCSSRSPFLPGIYSLQIREFRGIYIQSMITVAFPIFCNIAICHVFSIIPYS
jgi:hypothetical protein